MGDFEDVAYFHRKFGLPTQSCAEPIRELGDEVLDFRIGFIEEELQELKDARAAGDHAGMADALIDLVYVAMGTAHFANYPWHELWDEVQRANCDKERAVVPTERGGTLDIIKPEGWVPPNIERIISLHKFGYQPMLFPIEGF